ncbi:hypothetical protein ACU639_08005 [Streptomyces cynarae]|uniref:hypothetical protein n=1 Tax=Streptomyces cynarae TaxID=2981134 RepID=UPI00406CEA1E
MSTIWGPSCTVNTSFSLEHDLEHRLRLDPPLQEAAVKVVTWLTSLMLTPKQCHEAYLAYRGTGRAGTKAAVNGLIELHQCVAHGFRNRADQHLRTRAAQTSLRIA